MLADLKLADIPLPAFRLYRPMSVLANGWSDQYGGLHEAANYCGVPIAANYRLHGIWQHGCHGPWVDHSPALLCYNAPQAQMRTILVARRDQEALLKAAGYSHVRAIGLPIVYTPPSGLERQPRSLLVVPTHTLVGDACSDRSSFERYADEILAVSSGFERIVVCVHANCRINGFWVNEFASRGFEIVWGAQSNDVCALRRMRALFESFESVTTNGWGSHVAYALAFGARVSIHGTQPARAAEDFLRDATWAADPAALAKAMASDTHARRDAFLARLHVDPRSGLLDTQFGRQLIGAENQLSPSAMLEVLQAIVDPPPAIADEKRVGYQAAREQIFQRVRSLAQSGQRHDAIKVLMQQASVDIASKMPLVMLDGLTQIAAEITPLEPALAARIRGEAEKVAAAYRRAFAGGSAA